MDVNLKKMENNLITQSNKMVQNARFSDDITMRELKILYTVVSMIEPNDSEFKLYKFRVRELFDLFGLKKNTPVTVIKETAEKLLTRYVSVSSEDSNNFLGYSLISVCKYIENAGTLEIKINSDVKPFLLQLKRDFTSYKLLNILTLKSEYSIILYQYFKSYLHSGGSITVDVEEFKSMLFGKDNTKYSKYSLFKRDLLVRVLNEINSKTDLQIDFEEIKEGRSVKSLKFTITEKSITNKKTSENNIIDNKVVIFDLLKEKSDMYQVSITEKDFEYIYNISTEIWKDNDFSKLFELVEEVYKDKEIRNPVAFIKFKLKEYKENVDNGLEYNHNEMKRKAEESRRESVPDWFDERNENNPTKDDSNIDFEAERLKILAKLGIES